MAATRAARLDPAAVLPDHDARPRALKRLQAHLNRVPRFPIYCVEASV